MNNLLGQFARPGATGSPAADGGSAIAARGFLALLAAAGSSCSCPACGHLRAIAADLQLSLSQPAAASPAAGSNPPPPAEETVEVEANVDGQLMTLAVPRSAYERARSEAQGTI